MVDGYVKGHEVSVNGVLEKLSVSSSGYYSWKRRGPSSRELMKAEIKAEILRIYMESKKIYGAPKIREELMKRGYEISQKTVSKYMREEGIKAIWMKKYRPSPVKVPELELKNVLERNFSPERKDRVWVTDITYIWTSAGFVYLSSVMDLYSRKIISWEVSESLGLEFVLSTIRKAKSVRKLEKSLIIHSDRGSHYTSRSYIEETEEKNIERSYSRKSNPWDNAVIESFHSVIKREWLNRYRIRDVKEARALIFEYIETFYNSRRLHSYCGMLSPDKYEKTYG